MRRSRRALIAISMLLGVATLVPSNAAAAAPRTGELWVGRYDAAANTDDANAIAVSPDGSRVFTTGRSYASASGYDYATVAENAATGAPLWVQRYNGPGNGTDDAYAVAVSPDGTKVVVTGESRGSTSSDDYATIAYNAATGAGLWSKRYNGTGNQDDHGQDVAISPDGTKVFVTGYSNGGAVGYDYATVAYDMATGAQLWVRRFDGVDHSNDYALAVAVSPDGTKVFAAGYADMQSTGIDYVVTAMDASTGVGLWGQSYNGPANGSDYGQALAVSPDGSKVFVTGYSSGVSSGYDYATIGINAATGGKLWFRRFNGVGNSSDYGQAVAVSPDSSKVFVTGYSYGSGTGYDYVTTALSSATGAPIWGQFYNGPGNGSDYALDVAVTPDGTYVYVTGYASSGASGNDYATAAYVATNGAGLGVRRYNGPGNGSDYGDAIATSSTTVFVTGESRGVTTDYDYATAAYAI